VPLQGGNTLVDFDQAASANLAGEWPSLQPPPVATKLPVAAFEPHALLCGHLLEKVRQLLWWETVLQGLLANAQAEGVVSDAILAEDAAAPFKA
jgi:hypothetical protein